MEYLVYFILLALMAEILGTVGGFGSSMFFVPIASYFLDFHSVLGVTAIFHVLSNLTKIGFFHKGIDKKLIITLGIPAVVFVILGAYLSQFIDTKWLQIGLSVFLIALSLFFLIFKKVAIKPTTINSITGGVTSGFIAGLIGTGGAIRGITLAAFNLKMESFIATSAVIDLAIDGSRTIVYGLNGFIHKDDLYLIPILFVVSIIGTFIGKKLLQKISEAQFKKVVLVLILVTGIITAFNVAQKR
ncbi:sulfite exporter TauE/SafE family protein [Flavobacterium terrisoli]|uniref:sulfite exporter TauE/SafE family protein n=1 Tax=Flavobacterium terrisoli TaxID=3242195 RepID=UPI0025431D83|nr:sulfite exporter TauE/SafE family protein [Flavobacterium buctense]